MRQIGLCLLLFLLAAAGAAWGEDADHPLVTRYEGSRLIERKSDAFARYRLIVGQDEASAFVGRDLEGTLTRIVYQNPADRSTLEIFTNYRDAFTKGGGRLIYSCEMEDCGPGFARSKWNQFNGLFAAADGDPRYFSGQVATPGGGDAYVALMVGRRRTQLDILELAPMEQDKVVVDAAMLGNGIDADGFVVVEGIYFDVDRAVLKPESKPALDEVAALLAARPQLRVYVVGHTDMTGGFDHNMTLSRDRARAVVAALVKDHQVDPGRLEGHGVGPLAPKSTNAHEGGRAVNRRVVLVAR
ncbi:MAG: OmpA family protein [Sphingomonadales bacterium]